MKEKILKEYFEGLVSAKVLNEDVTGSKVKTGSDTYEINIQIIEANEEYSITLEHILKLCTDAIKGEISSENLSTIAFALIGSDYFEWNESDKIGKRISNIVFEWDNPEINFPITKENLKLWKEYLETGSYKLGI